KNAKSADLYFKDMPLANLQGSNCTAKTLGWEMGSSNGHKAIGTLRIYDDFSDPNLYVGFIPNGYGLMYGVKDASGWGSFPFKETSSAHVWITDVVSLTNEMVNGTYSYYVGLLTSEKGYTYCGNSETTGMSGMGTYANGAWRSNLSTFTAGQKGIFRMWDNSCNGNNTKNFVCHFVPYYSVIFNADGGTCATSPVDCSCEETTEIILPTPTREGYIFKGWYKGEEKVGGANETYKVTNPTANVTLTAVWEPYWTLRGSFESDDDAGWAKDHDFIDTANKGIATYSISLAANTQYKFKVKYGDTYYGLSGNGNYKATFNNCILSSSVNDNVVFTTGRAGTYLFTLNYNNSNEPQISVTYPTLKATTRYLIANAGVSAGALAANLIGAQVGVIKYDGTTYSVSDDISLNTYPGTKVYYYAETHLDHLGTEQDWSDNKTATTTVQALKFSTGTYTLQLGNLTATKIAFYGKCDKARTLTIAGTNYVYSGAQFIAQEVSGSFTGNVDVETSGEIYGVLLIDVEAGESCPTPAVAITEGFNDGTRTTYCADDANFSNWKGWTATITVKGMGADEQCLVSWVSQSNPTDTLQKTTYTFAQGTTVGGTTTFTDIYRATKGGTYNVQATVSASGKTSAHAKTSAAQLRLLTAPAKPTLTADIAQGDVAQGDVVKMTSGSNTNLWEYSTDGGDNWQRLPTVTGVHTWSPSENDKAGEYQFRCYAQNTNIEGCNQSKEPSNVLTYTLVAVAKNVPILTVTNNGACEIDGGATLTASHITDGATLAWFKEGKELTTHAGKTEIQVTESGSYTVVATVGGKAYSSTPAAVNVLATAKITTDLASDYSIVQGQTGVLSVKMSGAIRYQWYQCTSSNKTDAVPLMGETNDQLSVSIPLSDEAETKYYYYCVGAGECGGTVSSSVATVTVKALVYEACLGNGDTDYGFFTVTKGTWDADKSYYKLSGSASPLIIEAADGYYIKRVTFTMYSSADNHAFAFYWGDETPKTISIGKTAKKFTQENDNELITRATIVRNIKINGTVYGKDSGTRYITSCCVEVAPLCTPAGLAFSATSHTADYTDGILSGLPKLTNNASLPVSYSSSNPKVATVDSETGEVTPLAVGETKITAYTEGGTVDETTYCEGAASYTLTIQPPSGSTTFSATISGNTSVACQQSIVLTVNTTNANTPTYQWYKNGAAVKGATAATLTVTTAGTYNALVTANGYAQWTSNTATVTDESAQPVVTRLTPFHYYRHGCGYTQASDNRYRHLFNVVSQGTHTEKNGTVRRWYPYARLIKGDGKTADRYLTNVTDWVISDPENEHMVLLDLQTLASRNAGSGFLVPGDKVVISVRPVDACGNYSEEAADSIILTVTAQDTRAVAYIVSGGSGSTVKLGGHFLTGYNPSDLMLLTGKNTWSETDPDPLWYAIDTCKQYVVTPVNGYAPFNKYNYEPFDLIVLTDFPKTDKSEGGLSSATYLNDLAQLVDVKPFLSLKAHIAKAGMGQWADKGFVALPEVPSSTKTTIDLLCWSHSVFQRVTTNKNKVQESASDGTTAQQIEILSGGGYDKEKGLQG
ncbi:MAG: InlB B-repeat-containing protein, partial [Paludibacteraceae bacterium]